ncbi:MAG: hypothetical protein K0S33_1773 [Bacteroidetes bacterium]|jgi:hypothetical protein|nr:hypothetical protein [Bacteroidota bacterium]
MKLPYSLLKKISALFLFFMTADLPAQVIFVPSTQTICAGQPLSVSASGSFHPGALFQWKVARVSGGPYLDVTGGKGANSVSYTSQPLDAGTYYYVLAVRNTPYDPTVLSGETVVTVNELPFVIAHGTAPSVCNASSFSLWGSGAVSYKWTGGVVNATSFNPTATATYTVTGTNAKGCRDTDVIRVHVHKLPDVVAHTTENVVESGASVLLSGSGADVYTWSGNVENAKAFVPSTTETYIVTGTDVNGCKNSDMITVFVKAAPANPLEKKQSRFTANVKN